MVTTSNWLSYITRGKRGKDCLYYLLVDWRWRGWVQNEFRSVSNWRLFFDRLEDQSLQLLIQRGRGHSQILAKNWNGGQQRRELWVKGDARGLLSDSQLTFLIFFLSPVNWDHHKAGNSVCNSVSFDPRWPISHSLLLFTIKMLQSV